MAAAAAMTLLKLGAGLLSGSLGVLSDAAHSGLDLVGAALTYFSVNVSDKPADEDHTYGHGKIENLSAFGEAGLMAVSCAWIMWEAVQRIFYHAVTVHHSLWPVLVLVTSIGVDIWRSRQLRAVASAHRIAGAGHRCIPLRLGHLGHARPCWRLGRTWAGERFALPPCSYADPCAALVVSLMILRMTMRLGHEAVAALVDEIPAETRRASGARSGARGWSAGGGAGAGAARRSRLLSPTLRWRCRGDLRLSTPASWCRRRQRQCNARCPGRCGDPHRSPRNQGGKHFRPRARRGRAQQRFSA